MTDRGSLETTVSHRHGDTWGGQAEKDKTTSETGKFGSKDTQNKKNRRGHLGHVRTDGRCLEQARKDVNTYGTRGNKMGVVVPS